MRRLALAAAVGAALLLAPAASASSNARMGIQDDAWLMWGPGTLSQRLSTLRGLGVRTVRFTLRWDMVAARRPAHPLDPNDPAYAWGPFDAVLDSLHTRGITPVVTLWGAPKWSNGGHAPSWLPRSGFGDFAYAAAKRYPWVRLWTIWNEPNTRVFSVPVSPKLYVHRLLNPAYVLLHRAARGNAVAGGVTSPRHTASGMAPLDFMTGMHAFHARLDAYAANPYPSSPRLETPFSDPCRQCSTLTMARLPEIRRDVSRLFGARTPLWLTEYGYQTSPPDRILGVPFALQARYVGEAALRVWEQPGTTMLIHFLVRDEPTSGGWQSGLFTAHGSPKPSSHAFALPLAEESRHGSRVVLWGQVRPGSGRRAYDIQRWTGTRWVNVGGVKRTGVGGTFRTAVTTRPHTKVRLKARGVAFTSPPLVVE
ncbi:MAG TPA: hypothetical protein VKC62_08005 [Gaiellaceae bacterium]|nr:hypothetical protein [Gaiellaceae bacterium]